MTLKPEDKRWGRPTYDRVPRTLQEDTARVATRKRCLYLGHPGHAASGTSNEWTERVLPVFHPTVTPFSYQQDNILYDSLDHTIDPLPFANGAGYSLSDLDNAEIDVVVFGVGYVADMPEFPEPATLPSSFLPLFLNNHVRNDAAYPNGIEDMRRQGLRGYVRFFGNITQYINGIPTVVGALIGEGEEGGAQVGAGYQWRETDYLSLRAVNYKMGLHAYSKAVQVAGFSWQGSPAYNVWQGDRMHFKEGYMALEGTDILHQIQPENTNVLKYKLDPTLFDRNQPYLIRTQCRIYIPANVLSEVNGGVRENTSYPIWMEAYERNERPTRIGTTASTLELPDGTFVNRERLGYVICGLSVWGNNQ